MKRSTWLFLAALAGGVGILWWIQTRKKRAAAGSAGQPVNPQSMRLGPPADEEPMKPPPGALSGADAEPALEEDESALDAMI